MPLHRSARLFTLGLALAGTCAPRDTQNGTLTRAQLRQQQKTYRAANKMQKPPTRVSAPKPRKTLPPQSV